MKQVNQEKEKLLAKMILRNRNLFKSLSIGSDPYIKNSVIIKSELLLIGVREYIKMEKEVLSGTADNEIRNFNVESSS
jgi:hypothetical protein